MSANTSTRSPTPQTLNPLDRLFFATSIARQRLRLGGADIHLHLECGGEIDLHGLRRAVRCAAARYPVLAGRARLTLWGRRPAWALGYAPREDAVRVRRVDSATALHQELEALFAEEIDLWHGPLLAFDVLRGAAAGDLVVMRWPHALMDARGGATILETIAQDYEQGTDPRQITSAGDEARRDFGGLTWDASWRGRWRGMRVPAPEAARPPAWAPRRVVDFRPAEAGERAALVVRRLSTAQLHAVQANAIQVCGIGRLADFVRACGVQALHRTIGGETAAGGYSTFHLLDNRKRRDPGPVCHNVFSTAPVYVPAQQADDRTQIAERISDATRVLLDRDYQAARLAALDALTLLPTSWLARAMVRSLRTGRALLPVGIGNPVSLPMGFMGPLSRRVDTFCGARLENLYGTRAASPLGGYSVSVNVAQERLNLCAIYYPRRIARERIELLLDQYVQALLTGAGKS